MRLKSKELSKICILLIVVYLFTSSSFVLAREKSFLLIPNNKQVKVGETVQISVEAKNLQNVYSYEMIIKYDSSKLMIKDVNSEFNGYGFLQDATGDKLRYVFTLTGKDTPELNGDLTLCNIIATPKSSGDAELLLESIEIADRRLNTQQIYTDIKETIEIVKKSSSGGGTGGGSKPGKDEEIKDEDPEQSIEPSEPGKIEPEKTFDDIDNYPWAREAIEYLASKGIIKGTSSTTFSPAEPVKRADFILLLVRALEFSADFDSNFADVAPNAYYYEALGIAKTLGIAQGVGDNKFNPEAAISRQDLMVLIDRAMKIAGKQLVEGDESDLDIFADKSAIAPYALKSIATLVKNGIVLGDGSLINPLGNATRAETAVLIYRVYNM